ncbi:Cytochrome c peroxidase (modular protein) [Candidatus Sulfopaludibacter sp. SbA3]|nr:Cytochrome c peroxidase (modular protein) [Candidatus Sulfopaludibacter sp. SbA3]
MRTLLALLCFALTVCHAHDAHGHSTAPPEARLLKSPIPVTDAQAAVAQPAYDRLCAGCHGADGKARTPVAGKLPVRPTNLAEYLMESMRDGEIFWVIGNGIGQNMPAFAAQLDETQRWQVVQYVRLLRLHQRNAEREKLGPYEWNLPPGFPLPNVPLDDPMTKEKVALGRYLFYDKRLSLNQTQACATCHRQERAFTDGRSRGVGSTGQVHPRGPMSLVNVAYAPVLTWANPLARTLEMQALVPLFGENPIELGMTGKEDLLVQRLKSDARYRKLFAAAFPSEADPFTVRAVTQAIASFERTILSGDSPYDRYRNGDDPNAIPESAKRGEALFFSERLECFHCHGGFNFTGTVDYLDKGFAEVEFHNTGLYNLNGKLSYPPPNLGLYEFTHSEEDIGKFKAPTLRNIAVTAPYMHDGSIKTLEEAVDHYRSGGRTIKTGPNAGVGSENPNKSEFVKRFDLSPQERADVLAFLRSLTDRTILTDPSLSDPFVTVSARSAPQPPRYVLHGQVVHVYLDAGAITLYHDEVPGLIRAMKAPYAMEFLVPDRESLKKLRAGQTIAASVRRQGADYVLEDLRASPSTDPTRKGKR